MKTITALIALAVGIALATPVLAEDDQTSGNYWLHECKKDPKQLAQSSGLSNMGGGALGSFMVSAYIR